MSSMSVKRLESDCCTSSASENLSLPSCIDSCATRIQQAIQELKVMIPYPNDEKIICPITCEVPKEPVVTSCGHIFERVALLRWEAQRQQQGLPVTCATCNAGIPFISAPVSAICDIIEEWHQEAHIPTFSFFEERNERLASHRISLARKYVEKGDFQEALEVYGEAFRYTERSDDYAAIPQIYDQLGEEDKATLSLLYLSQYQLKEGRIAEAIETLKSIKYSLVDVNTAIAFLQLQFPEMVTEVMDRAQKITNAEDQIAIYNQILTIDPYRFDAHLQLISLTQDPAMRKERCLQAANFAHQIGNVELEREFHFQADRLTVLTKDMLINGQNLPPLPEELETWLNEPCPFTLDRTRRDTHIVFPMFPQVSLDDNAPPVDLNLGTLDQLDKRTQGPGYRYLWDQIPQDIGTTENFCWGAMYRDVIPGSRNRRFDDQQRLLPEGYEVPGVYEAALGILWEQRRTGTRCFSNDPWTSTYCKEVGENVRLAVGGFTPAGLHVGYVRYDD